MKYEQLASSLNLIMFPFLFPKSNQLFEKIATLITANR